jgi:hypothetical protein
VNAGPRRIVLGAALLLTLAGAWYVPEAAPAAAADTRHAAGRAAVQAPQRARDGQTAAVADVFRIGPRDVEDEDAARDPALFRAAEWTPASASPAAAAATEPAVAPLPPLPFRVMGSFEQAGQTVVFLQHNERNLVVREGDTIDDLYKVESVAGAMTLRYLPLDRLQTLELGRTLKEK